MCLCVCVCVCMFIFRWNCGVAVAEGEVQGGLVEGFRNNVWFYVRQEVCEFECVRVCVCVCVWWERFLEKETSGGVWQM